MEHLFYLEVIMKVGDRAYIHYRKQHICPWGYNNTNKRQFGFSQVSYGKGIQIHRNRIYGSRDSALKAIGKQLENKIVPNKDKLKWNAQML